MARKPIELVLQDESHIERPESKALRLRALEVLTVLRSQHGSVNVLSDTLYELLDSILKPLFSQSFHPKLTSAGRKVLVNNSLPESITGRFSTLELEDGLNRPLWKNGWTSSLLLYILNRYADIVDSKGQADTLKQKAAMEAHFYLLVPPILKQLDDMHVTYKASGCRCLQLLCNHLAIVRSNILKQSGLMDVFIEALRNDFSMLPTLTPEDESLELYEALYPAYRSLVRAHSQVSDREKPEPLKLSAAEERIADDGRQSYLTSLLRHQLLHGLVHLSTGLGGGSTMSLPLSTFLVSQLSWIFQDMGLCSVKHLQTVLPRLRNILSDPFGTSSTGLLSSAIKALQDIIQICWPRVRTTWWTECLRSIVSCWLNVGDDEAGATAQQPAQRTVGLEEVKQQLQIVACMLEDIVGEEYSRAMEELVSESPELAGLFVPPSKQDDPKLRSRTMVSVVQD